MSGELTFDLTPAEEPVVIGGRRYVLREASGAAACQWRNALLGSARLGEGGRPVGFDGMADAEPLLVSLCLFEATEKGERPVPLATVRGWPNRVVKPLFERAKAISGLDEKPEGEDQEKNSPATPAG